MSKPTVDSTGSPEVYRLAVGSDRTEGPQPTSNAPSLKLFNNCYVSYGIPFEVACAKHAGTTFNSSRIYIVSSRTLAESTDALSKLRDALQDKVVGVKTGLKAHTSWNDILAMKRECVDLGVDLIVTLGGGSLTDAAKLLSLVSGSFQRRPY